jgi:exonuclease VII large subunit
MFPFAEAGEITTTAQLDDALRTGHSPIQSVIDRLEKTVELDIRDLRSHLEARANISEMTALAELAENGRREADAMADLLDRQIQKVGEAMREKKAPDQLAFDFSTEQQKQHSENEIRRFEADRRSWDEKLVRLQHDLDNEPQKVKDSYEVKALQLEPLGIVYLWPVTN